MRWKEGHQHTEEANRRTTAALRCTAVGAVVLKALLYTRRFTTLYWLRVDHFAKPGFYERYQDDYSSSYCIEHSVLYRVLDGCYTAQEKKMGLSTYTSSYVQRLWVTVCGFIPKHT